MVFTNLNTMSFIFKVNKTAQKGTYCIKRLLHYKVLEFDNNLVKISVSNIEL